MRAGKDWTLMLQFSSLPNSQALSKYWTKIGFVLVGLQIRTIAVHSVCSVFDFEFNLKTLKRFNMGT